MAFQSALLAFGPAGWLACGVVTVVMMAGAMGVFDQSEVTVDDTDDDGIYIPAFPPPEIPDDGGEDEDGDGHAHVNPDPHPNRKPGVYPWGFVYIMPTAPPGDDWRPDDPDLPVFPSSSFEFAASAHDSGAWIVLAALATFLPAYFVCRSLTGAGR